MVVPDCNKGLQRYKNWLNFLINLGHLQRPLKIISTQRSHALKTDVKTRWNYQFIAALHFLSLSSEKLEHSLIDHGCKKLQSLKLNQIDREVVGLACIVLQDFHEATLLTSADKKPTITHVLPLTVGIINGLIALNGNAVKF